VTHVIDEIDDLEYPLSQLPKIHAHFIVLREEINWIMSQSFTSLWF